MMGYKSNASLSKEAGDASAKALEASSNVRGDDESHGTAASAHYQAAYKQQDAGNATQAQFHRNAAKLHSEKAEAGRRAVDFASQQGRAAEELSKKADMSAFGQDENELRNPKQLHADAQEAHEQASKAFKAAGKKRDADYHDAKAEHHGGQAETTGVEDTANANVEE